MPAHYCINPLDPYAEQEVLVTYDDHRPFVTVRSAVDEEGYDILTELSAECIRILQLEIAGYHGHTAPYAWTPHAVDVVAAPEVA
ncbi:MULTISPECIES: hypothetical protein [unclassified Methylobacterium]|jgi:hypothetical protein|uniref:hypothetical protein n=1 Tax=unclassified Methylobacterium TaxID=2615210 RepID=UPI0011C1F4CD|nr:MULTISPECIES: hypothetical protein [unclassified Methylobacterium]QEE38987.1 hypothetical protein FVA80_08525 [Methylobacterium sp. WL1]TXM97633.1 hypothetical protein FV242_31030 [Methylobacterium sp. WL64]TXN53929.1 hypothetical protein FV241_26140 [Methylobacterium sp. WL2]